METLYTFSLTANEIVGAQIALKIQIRQAMKFRSYEGKLRMEKRAFIREDIATLRKMRKATGVRA